MQLKFRRKTLREYQSQRVPSRYERARNQWGHNSLELLRYIARRS